MASTNADPQSQAALQAVMQALDALYKNPDKAAKDQANQWLQDFQKTPEAWQTANSLLLAQDLPTEPRLFAAQTFRSKTTFDLDQVPESSRAALRDTLLTALAAYAAGPKVIQTQICLALAALALQMTDDEWPDVVKCMSARFGNDPASVSVLLEFLTVLPEEVTSNHRIPVDTGHFNVRVKSLLGDNVDEILRLLTMYIQASGITPQLQSSVFQCLRSWLKSGEIATASLLNTPLFQFSFDALASDSLFDVATDVVCDLIHETQEVDENLNVIPAIAQRLLPLREELAKAGDDEDKVRGICRIFAEAGETYHTLILRHQGDFFPIVETLIECAAYHDLEIVQITFRFWYLLAAGLGKRRQDATITPFLQVYARLLDIIIGHLRFPDDNASQTAAERDEFRAFRHYMGDTLKDCCYVLGSKECLGRSLHMIQEILSTAQASGVEPSWQAVEAPLFSMRAMGTEVRVHDQDEIIGQIIEIIPNLPAHPRMRYAGLLVISRYTEWIDLHPEKIPGLLSYISAGLESEGDVAAAAGQAMGYMCQDCKQHLVPYLPQLHEFLEAVGDRLEPDDLITMGEGIGHIVSTMSPEEAPAAMMRFSQPILQLIASVAAEENASRNDLKRANIRIDMLERFLDVIGSRFVDSFPAECSKTVTEAYQVIESLLAKHGAAYWIHQATVNLFRRSMIFFGPLVRSVLPAMVEQMATLFAATGFSGYLWIIGRAVDGFARDGDQHFAAAVQKSFETVSGKVAQLLNSSMPRELPDIIEDYVDVSSTILDEMPALLVLSPILPHAFRTAITALTLVQPEIIQRALDFIRRVVGHDALTAPSNGGSGGMLPVQYGSDSAPLSQEELARFAVAIRSLMASPSAPSESLDSGAPTLGYQLVLTLLEGLVTTFPPEELQTVGLLFKLLLASFPQECVEWISHAVQALPASSGVGAADRTRLLEQFAANVERGDLINGVVRGGLIDGLYRVSRKSRERLRMDSARGSGSAGHD